MLHLNFLIETFFPKNYSSPKQSLVFPLLTLCFSHSISISLGLTHSLFYALLLSDGSREQAYVERSIRELIDSSKQSVEDMRYRTVWVHCTLICVSKCWEKVMNSLVVREWEFTRMIGGELLPLMEGWLIVTAVPNIYIAIWFDWSSHIDVYNTSFSHPSTHSLDFLIYRKECEELEADERTIDSKIKKKQEELDRTEKRLRSLENVRPQFMDEVRTHSVSVGDSTFYRSHRSWFTKCPT